MEILFWIEVARLGAMLGPLILIFGMAGLLLETVIRLFKLDIDKPPTL